jgi:glycosyltransferase involved in cell wall biosynthesis
VETVPLIAPRRSYARERAELRRMFAELAPDVLHSHGYHTDVIAGDVARRAKIPTVSTAHGYTRGPWLNRVYEYLDRRALRSFDAVAAVSRRLADELVRSGVPAERVHVIPNAWSPVAIPLDRESARRELGLDPRQFVVGWVGRMTREKGLDVLVDTMAMLKDIPAIACAVGAGPEREREEARANALGIGSRIHWTGLVREAERFFPAFDALVLSSRTEGVPMVVLEAMARGVPLVATKVGGVPDVASNHEALLVPPEQPAAIATAVRSVYGDRPAAVERAASARARIERDFAEADWLRRYDDVYDSARARVLTKRHNRE